MSASTAPSHPNLDAQQYTDVHPSDDYLPTHPSLQPQNTNGFNSEPPSYSGGSSAFLGSQNAIHDVDSRGAPQSQHNEYTAPAELAGTEDLYGSSNAGNTQDSTQEWKTSNPSVTPNAPIYTLPQDWANQPSAGPGLQSYKGKAAEPELDTTTVTKTPYVQEEEIRPQPQTLDDVPPPQPPRPQTGHVDTAADLEKVKQQRSETYQVKKINWFDANSEILRESPILIQNKNGPCPLLALVNALVLSVPPNVESAVVSILRTREQVTLGLLMDAVFDELTSGRRGDVFSQLPDVDDLYKFLLKLHTGMNVNPRFLPKDSPPPNLIDARMSTLQLSDNAVNARSPGVFEETQEIRLYSTFTIPLIHGWLPPKSHPAYGALQRVAKTYEDAQNILFREEELEDKLSGSGLSPQEQQLLEDISSIKYFLSSSATQLTGYGLDTITETLELGDVAILFRNDHFSTIYRNPHSKQLLTLVTDAGFASHPEVVWESIVDVTGEGSEFLSGDFRIVGNAPQSRRESVQTADDGFTPVVNKRSRRNPRADEAGTSNSIEPQTAGGTEQEDADLALALQLQEEEEDAHRRAQANRDRRENDRLSTEYLDAQSARTPNSARHRSSATEARPAIPPRNPPRRNPGVNRPAAAEGGEAPPPTYEQAATGRPYIPPTDHPSHPNHPTSPPNGPGPNTRYGPPGRGQHNMAPQGFNGPAPGAGAMYSPGMRRRSTLNAAEAAGGMVGGRDRNKDCVVM